MCKRNFGSVQGRYDKQMIIGIDGNEANVTNRVGVNKYAFEILKGIHKLLPENPDLIVYVYLKGKPVVGMPTDNKRFKYIVLPVDYLSLGS